MYPGKLCVLPSPAGPPPAPRRERLRNWLALLALLAIGIVWQ
jgi:MYXO-CTERM domain-containing protein